MNILDAWIYKITIIVMIIGFLITFLWKKNFWQHVYDNKQKYYIFIGCGLLIIELSYIIVALIHKTYFRLLSGDMCAFIALIAPPIMLAHKENVIKILSPWMVAAALVTMFVSHPGFVNDSVVDGLISYLKHVFILAAGFIITITVDRYSTKSLLALGAFPFVLGSFIILTTGVTYWVTGKDYIAAYLTAMFEPSYHKILFTINGQEYQVSDYEIFGKLNMPYPVPSLIFYILTTGAVYGFALLFHWIGFKYIANKQKNEFIVKSKLQGK